MLQAYNFDCCKFYTALSLLALSPLQRMSLIVENHISFSIEGCCISFSDHCIILIGLSRFPSAHLQKLNSALILGEYAMSFAVILCQEIRIPSMLQIYTGVHFIISNLTEPIQLYHFMLNLQIAALLLKTPLSTDCNENHFEVYLKFFAVC